MSDPYANTVVINNVLGGVTGAFGDLVTGIGEWQLRKQIEAALERAKPRIAQLMPQGPRPGQWGVLAVAVTEQWKIANEIGGVGGSFKRLDLVGAFMNQKTAIDTYERSPRLEGVTPGYTINHFYIWMPVGR